MTFPRSPKGGRSSPVLIALVIGFLAWVGSACGTDSGAASANASPLPSTVAEPEPTSLHTDSATESLDAPGDGQVVAESRADGDPAEQNDGERREDLADPGEPAGSAAPDDDSATCPIDLGGAPSDSLQELASYLAETGNVELALRFQGIADRGAESPDALAETATLLVALGDQANGLPPGCDGAVFSGIERIMSVRPSDGTESPADEPTASELADRLVQDFGVVPEHSDCVATQLTDSGVHASTTGFDVEILVALAHCTALG